MDTLLNEEQIEAMDRTINALCAECTPEELAYLLQQLKELNHRGSF